MGSVSRATGPANGSGHPVTLGITDLMTSLAVVFALLMVVFANGAHRPDDRPVAPPTASSTTVEPVHERLQRSSPGGVGFGRDPDDPHVLRVVIPDTLLTFESGKSALAAAGERFVADVIPSWAVALCGGLRDRVEGVVIEGHTDDLGPDAFNLRLSQERSLGVLIRALEAIQLSAPEAYACFSALASASGRGKQDLVYDDQRRPDREQSRRVVLKILLRAGAGPA